MSLFLQLQRALPQAALSRLVGRFAASERTAISQLFIRTFAAAYRVRLDEAGRPTVRDYRSFNDFFTRELADGARGSGSGNDVISPADGMLSQCGQVQDGALLQAKGKVYSCAELVGDDALARTFDGGWFATVYLAPADYHRVHLPFAGRLRRTREIPGSLFSVNATTEAGLSDLFCRNERLVCEFETSFGTMVVVLVGALIVASIETVWEGPTSPYRERRERDYDLRFPRGAEIGRFLLGSTVILLMPPGSFTPAAELRPGQKVQVGTRLGDANP